jgi:hypothetical protein
LNQTSNGINTSYTFELVNGINTSCMFEEVQPTSYTFEVDHIKNKVINGVMFSDKGMMRFRARVLLSVILDQKEVQHIHA